MSIVRTVYLTEIFSWKWLKRYHGENDKEKNKWCRGEIIDFVFFKYSDKQNLDAMEIIMKEEFGNWNRCENCYWCKVAAFEKQS